MPLQNIWVGLMEDVIEYALTEHIWGLMEDVIEYALTEHIWGLMEDVIEYALTEHVSVGLIEDMKEYGLAKHIWAGLMEDVIHYGIISILEDVIWLWHSQLKPTPKFSCTIRECNIFFINITEMYLIPRHNHISMKICSSKLKYFFHFVNVLDDVHNFSAAFAWRHMLQVLFETTQHQLHSELLG